ncbi:MAG TPA: dTMP kinase [Phycisphaerae bacterium]|nr:dTMP kinase [Phycisphaerae bacterium]
MADKALVRLRGKYIVFDGIDGAGKGAQLARLTQQLADAGIETILARDPGGTPIGDRIRHVLLDFDLSAMDVRCEAFLFMASRAQLVTQVIGPALSAGKTCLGDRFVSATCAYQGAAGFDPRRVVELAKFAIGDQWPHLTIVLDVPLAAGLERTKRPVNNKKSEATGDRHPTLFHDVHPDAMESRPMDFHQRVRELFLELPKYYPAPVAIVDGVGSVDEVQARVMEAIAHAAL